MEERPRAESLKQQEMRQQSNKVIEEIFSVQDKLANNAGEINKRLEILTDNFNQLINIQNTTKLKTDMLGLANTKALNDNLYALTRLRQLSEEIQSLAYLSDQNKENLKTKFGSKWFEELTKRLQAYLLLYENVSQLVLNLKEFVKQNEKVNLNQLTEQERNILTNFRSIVESQQKEVQAGKHVVHSTSSMALTDLLFHPPQILQKYPLLFRELSKYTPMDNPDYKAYANISAKATAVCSYANELKRIKEKDPDVFLKMNKNSKYYETYIEKSNADTMNFVMMKLRKMLEIIPKNTNNEVLQGRRIALTHALNQVARLNTSGSIQTKNIDQILKTLLADKNIQNFSSKRPHIGKTKSVRKLNALMSNLREIDAGIQAEKAKLDTFITQQRTLVENFRNSIKEDSNRIDSAIEKYNVEQFKMGQTEKNITEGLNRFEKMLERVLNPADLVAMRNWFAAVSKAAYTQKYFDQYPNAAAKFATLKEDVDKRIEHANHFSPRMFKKVSYETEQFQKKQPIPGEKPIPPSFSKK